MKLIDLLSSLQALVDAGHGQLPVYYRHGASGDCGELSSPHVEQHVDECGPFDLDGSSYISVYAGD